MPPNSPNASQAIPSPLKNTQPLQSKVQALLGLSIEGAVPLAAAVSLPRVELPYVSVQSGNAALGIVTHAASWENDPEIEFISPEPEYPDSINPKPSLLEAKPEFQQSTPPNPFPAPKPANLDNQTAYIQTSHPRPVQSSALIKPTDTQETSEASTDTPPSSLHPTSPSTLSIDIPGMTPRVSQPLPSDQPSSAREKNSDQASGLTSERLAASVEDIESLNDKTFQPHSSLAESIQSIESVEFLKPPKPLEKSHPTNPAIPTANSASSTKHEPLQLSERRSIVEQIPAHTATPEPDLLTSIHLANHLPANTIRPTHQEPIPEYHQTTNRIIDQDVTTNEYAVKRQPLQTPSPDKSSAPLKSRTALNSSAMNLSERLQNPEAAANSPQAVHYLGTQRATQKETQIATQIEALERTVANLSAQVSAQQEFQPPPVFSVSPVTPPIPLIAQPSAPPPIRDHAFWERSYMSRVYRWSRR